MEETRVNRKYQRRTTPDKIEPVEICPVCKGKKTVVSRVAGFIPKEATCYKCRVLGKVVK